MKKLEKVLNVLVIAIMLVCICTNIMAVDIEEIKANAALKEADAGATQLNKLGGTIIAYITNAAMVVAVVMVAILGIKYMMGSVEEKAEYKKSFVPLLVGAVLVFGAAVIAKIIVSLAESF